MLQLRRDVRQLQAALRGVLFESYGIAPGQGFILDSAAGIITTPNAEPEPEPAA